MGNILHLEQFSFPPAGIFNPDRFDQQDLGLCVSPTFHFMPSDRIFVMGSCFAAEVRNALAGRGFAATDAGQGHKYNTFSMLQTLDWALNDSFEERFLAPLKDGRYVDGHRHPTLTFDTAEAGVAEHRALLKKVRGEILGADIVVLTLGLVEVWEDRIAGVWLNQTPPVNQLAQPDRFQVRLTTQAQNLQAFQTLLLRLHAVNPACRVVCSVSPVPLKATFCGEDVIVANCYSKSTLRSAVSEAIHALHQNPGMIVDYFPAYELATLRPREEVWRKTIRDNEPDGRHVRREFIDQSIMKLFLDRYVEDAANVPLAAFTQAAAPASPASIPTQPPADAIKPVRRVLCNSWPKAGTHAALELVQLALGEGDWYKDPDIKYPRGEQEFLAKAGERLRRYEGHSFAIKGHYGRTPAIESFLAKHGFAHLFVVRDPREVLCSTQRWLRDLRPGWEISRYLASLDPAGQLEQIILGLPLLPPFDQDFAVCWDKPLPDRYAALTRWIDAPGCCVLAFEDLTGKRGVPAQLQAIESALRCLQIPFSPEDASRIARFICNPAAATFHTGPASDWEQVFTDRHRHLFVESGGEALVERLGYLPTLSSQSRASKHVPAQATATVPAAQKAAPAQGNSGDSGEQQFIAQLAKFLCAKSVLKIDWKSAGEVHCSVFAPTGQTVAVRPFRTSTPSLPFKDEECDALCNLASLNLLDESSLRRWLAELRRVTKHSLWLALEAVPGRDRGWWEARLIEAGFRKHPLSQCILPFEAIEQEGSSITLLVEKVPQTCLDRYPLEMLKAERDLHMDMLREPGIRSDAHLARYTLAREHLKPGMVVLDAACGLGYGSSIMATRTGVLQVIGVDCSEWSVDYARVNYAAFQPQLEFRAGDATRLRFLADACVDAVVSFETLEHLVNPRLLLREFARVLKPGGLFIGSVPNLWINEKGHNPVPYHFHIYDHDQFQQQVAGSFNWLALYRQNAGGGWKRPQPRVLRAIDDQRPTAADLQDAEWWIGVASKPPAQCPADPERREAALMADGSLTQPRIRVL